MEQVSDRIRAIVERVMPGSAVRLAHDDLLTAHGMDSMVATEIAGALADDFGIPLRPAIAFEYPTLALLSERVAQLVAERDHSLSGVVVFRRGSR